jgi:lipopolysaccharide cholinephosphotransferase
MNLFRSFKQRFLPASSRSFHAAENQNSLEHQLLLDKINGLEEQLKDVSLNLTSMSRQIEEAHEFSALQHSYEQDRDMLLFWSLYQQEGEGGKDAKLRFFHSLPSSSGTHKLFQDAEAKLLKQFDEFCSANFLTYWANGGTVLGAYRHGDFIPWDDDIDVYMPFEQIEKLSELVKRDGRFRVTVVWDWYVPCKQIRFRLADETNPCFIDLFVVNWISSDPEEALSVSLEYRERFIHSVREKYSHSDWDKVKYIDASHPLVPSLENELSSIRSQMLRELKGCAQQEGATGFVRGLENISERTPSGPYPIDEWVPSASLTFRDVQLPGPRNVEQYLQRTYGDYFSLPKDMHSHEHVADDYIGSDTSIDSLNRYLSC